LIPVNGQEELMGLKLIVVLASGRGRDERAINLGAQMAVEHDAKVEIRPVYSDSAADMIALGAAVGAALSQTVIDELLAAEGEVQRRIETVARMGAAKRGAAFGFGVGGSRISVLARKLQPALALARRTALADLVVLAHDQSGDSPMRRHLGEVLLNLGAPVLVARGDGGVAGAAAIAWDGSPQAGRAIRASLPMLQRASSVHVVQCPTGLDFQANDPDIGRLKDYLDLYGVGIDDVELAEGDDEGAALLSLAQSRGAALFVAGAWGRSRVRETIFGGATRTFLQKDEGPSLLLAH